MAKTQNYPLKTYSNGVWTDLVAADVVLEGLIITNTTAGTLNVQVRLVDFNSGAEIAILQPTLAIPAGGATRLDVGGVAVSPNQRLQAQASATGIHFLAFGPNNTNR